MRLDELLAPIEIPSTGNKPVNPSARNSQNSKNSHRTKCENRNTAKTQCSGAPGIKELGLNSGGAAILARVAIKGIHLTEPTESGTQNSKNSQNSRGNPPEVADGEATYHYFLFHRNGKREEVVAGTAKTLQRMMEEHPDCAVDINSYPPAPVGGPPKAADAHFCWKLTWPYGHTVTEVTIPALTADEVSRLNPTITCEPFQPQRPVEQAPPEIQQHLCELVYAGKLTDDECDFACIYWNCWPEQDWRCRWLRHLLSDES